MAKAMQDSTAFDLTRLLNRLERNILSPSSLSTLKDSVYVRARVGANLEHARGLLFRLEHEQSTSKSASQKSTRQVDLQGKRALIRKLQNRLFELGQQQDTAHAASSPQDTSGEEIYRRYVSHVEQDTSPALDDLKPTPSINAISTIRSRRPQESSARDTAQASGASTSGRPPPATIYSTSPFAPKGHAPLSSSETLLEHHTSEQEALSTQLLTLATALKTSTLSFADTLNASSGLVDNTAQALDKNITGMDSASKRMGMLRRMTEGKGWWARLGLYGWIAVLWVTLLVVVFVLPKLRFSAAL